MQSRIQMWVDVEALDKAILESPLTASTAWPIYLAVGLVPVSGCEHPSHRIASLSQPSESGDLCSDSTLEHPSCQSSLSEVCGAGS